MINSIYRYIQTGKYYKLLSLDTKNLIGTFLDMEMGYILTAPMEMFSLIEN